MNKHRTIILQSVQADDVKAEVRTAFVEEDNSVVFDFASPEENENYYMNISVENATGLFNALGAVLSEAVEHMKNGTQIRDEQVVVTRKGVQYHFRKDVYAVIDVQNHSDPQLMANADLVIEDGVVKKNRYGRNTPSEGGWPICAECGHTYAGECDSCGGSVMPVTRRPR